MILKSYPGKSLIAIFKKMVKQYNQFTKKPRDIATAPRVSVSR